MLLIILIIVVILIITIVAYSQQESEWSNTKVHHMQVSERPFNKIVSGQKVIESRLYDEKRREINVGDTIMFYQNNNPEKFIEVVVVKLLKFNSFKELFDDNEPHLFGEESREFLLNQIKEFYSEEDEKRFGIVGICFKFKSKRHHLK